MIDVKEFLEKELGIAGDDLALVATKLTPYAEKLDGAVLRQADYSKNMNELKTAQAALDQANERLNRDIADWGQLTAAEKKTAEGLRKQIEDSQAEVTRAHNALRKVAVDAGLDVNAVFEELKVKPTSAPAPAPAPAAPDMTGYAKTSDMHAASMLALTIPAELMQLAQEHQALTGQPLDTRKIATELIARANTKGNQKSLEPRQVWEELEGIPAKREAASRAKYDADIAAAEQRGRNAALTESALPTGGTPAGHSSPVFTQIGGKDANKAQRPPGARTGVSSAVEALATGKYREPVKKSA